MERTYYEKIYYTAEQFKGERALMEKYGIKKKKSSNGLLRFFLGSRRVPVGSWIVRKKYTDKIEIVDNYGFKLRFTFDQ